jgi:hypothetical protein
MSEVNLLNKKISEISNCIKNQDFDNFNQFEIINMSECNILLFLNSLVTYIQYNQHYKYKFSHYENTVKLIVEIIIKSNNINKKIDLTFNNLSILCIISNVNNSHFYLNKIKKIIKKNNYYNIDLLCHVAEKSTMPVFLFWWNTFFKNKIFSVEDYINILSFGIINTDDRIYQFILDQKNIQNIDYIFTNENKKLILTKLLSLNIIPRKYIQKKIKTLSQKTDLTSLVEFMIILTPDIKIKKTLLTYYYNSILSFDVLKNLVVNCCFDYKSAVLINNLLKTSDEKYIFVLLCNLNGYYHDNICISSIKNNLLIQYKDYIIDKICSQLNVIYEFNNFTNGLNNILYYYQNNNLLQDYIIKYYSNGYAINLIKYIKFFVFPNTVEIIWLNKNIQINKALHLLRCILKKYSNCKFNNFNYKYKPIINEIKNFKPSNKFKILHNGSLGYQLHCQKYSTIPPRHLLPLEDILHKNYLIKEKADGILTFILPTQIYPHNNDIFNYEIKAEFIEDLNVYLIFDINIPNTSILERQHYLRSIHYETTNIQCNTTINNFEILIDEIKKERCIFKNFLEKNKSEFKWYPKGSWKIFMNENIYTNLLTIIEETNDKLDFILNGEFNCDGLILTPLNGSRELKIKPKKLQTIDLLYSDTKWLDSNNKEWDIIKIPNKKYQNKIYRCYPQDNKYIATEIRYDKKKPNSGKIIDQIQNITNFNWLKNIDLLINKESYYELKQKLEDSYLINILNYQKSLLSNMLKELNPDTNRNWLDLGCGKSKLYEIIKNIYMPKKYLGIDNDTKILSNKYYIVDNSNDIVNLYPCDLSNKWDNINLWNSFDWTIKYDYIVANFSIMHFWSDLFWEQLNKVTKTGSILLFNVVKENINWTYNQSYLISNEIETKIYFKWTHKKEHIEKIISDNLINETIKKYNWTLKKIVNSNNLLASCYNWYIILKL